MAGKASQLETMFAPAIEALGCELWGVEFHSHGKQSMLRIFIEKHPDGVLVEDCERVSRQVSSILDVEDPIAGEYTLEVSSPGVDRPLFKIEQYAQFVGGMVDIKLRIAFDGRRNFKGLLKGLENDEVVLEIDKEEYLLPFELIDKARVAPVFK